ncbi:MAG: hypothetical protein WDM76_10875 [Limisphaerales bacterium]
MTKTFHARCLSRPHSWLAALLVLLILLTGAMSASPSLHKLIHPDADNADHECAVTMFEDGQIDTVICDVPVVVPTVWVEVAARVEFSVFSAVIQNLPSDRAPPVCLSVS